MKRNVFLTVLIILFFSLVYTAKADGVTAAGVFEVPNVLPIVKISAYSDETFRSIKNYVNKGDNIFVKIEVEDANGKDDISSVNVKIARIGENSETLMIDYMNATFVEGSENKAVYRYRFNADEDSKGYRIYVMVKDGKDQLVQTLELSNTGNNPAITGAVVLENNVIITFFKRIFRNIINLF